MQMMFASMNYCCWRAEIIRKSEDEISQKNEFEKIEEAQIVFDIQKTKTANSINWTEQKSVCYFIKLRGVII